MINEPELWRVKSKYFVRSLFSQVFTEIESMGIDYLYFPSEQRALDFIKAEENKIEIQNHEILSFNAYEDLQKIKWGDEE